MSAAKTRSSKGYLSRYANGEPGLRFDNVGRGAIRVPGMGYAVTIERPPNERFAHGFDDWAQDRLTARELAMLLLMNELTDRQNWHVGVFNDELTGRWQVEALSRPFLSPLAWNWCLLELRDKARELSADGQVYVFDSASRVCKSDLLVSDEQMVELRNSAAPLFRECLQRQHDSTFAAVDPDLFQLTYGRTRILRMQWQNSVGGALDSSGPGETVPCQPIKPYDSLTRNNNRRQHGREWINSWDTHPERFSERFQWLPCDVGFLEYDDGAAHEVRVRIKSYINNLHPIAARPMYQVIENLIAHSIGLWNGVLVYRNRGRYPRRIKTFGVFWWPPLPDWVLELPKLEEEKSPDAYEAARKRVMNFVATPWSVLLPQLIVSSNGSSRVPPPDFGAQLADGELTRAIVSKWSEVKTWLHPEPGISFSYDSWKQGKAGQPLVPPPQHLGCEQPAGESDVDHQFYTISLQQTFREQGLQVVVEIASVELTPENPSVPMTTWGIHGSGNEHIVASTIIYFDSLNMTPASGAISFRVEADLRPANFNWDVSGLDPIAHLYGLPSGRSLWDRAGNEAVQVLGTVLAPDGRLVSYPNVLQHRVEAFELLDKALPGRRRYIKLHLVDPHYRILSTRNVSPQRYDWWQDRGLGLVDWKRWNLPAEVVRMIMKEVAAEKWPMTLEEAVQLRDEAVSERLERMKKLQERVQRYRFEW